MAAAERASGSARSGRPPAARPRPGLPVPRAPRPHGARDAASSSRGTSAVESFDHRRRARRAAGAGVPRRRALRPPLHGGPPRPSTPGAADRIERKLRAAWCRGRAHRRRARGSGPGAGRAQRRGDRPSCAAACARRRPTTENASAPSASSSAAATTSTSPTRPCAPSSAAWAAPLQRGPRRRPDGVEPDHRLHIERSACRRAASRSATRTRLPFDRDDLDLVQADRVRAGRPSAC